MFRVRVNVSKKGYLSKNHVSDLNGKVELYEEKALTIFDLGAYFSTGHAWRASRLKPKAKRLSKGNYDAAQIIALDFDGLEDLDGLVDRFADFGICPNFIYPSLSQNPDTWGNAIGAAIKITKNCTLASEAEIYTQRQKETCKNYQKMETDFPTSLKEDGTRCIDLTSICNFCEEEDPSRHFKGGYNFRAVYVLEEECSLTKYEQVVSDLLELFPEADKATKDHSRLWFGGDLQPVYLVPEPVPLSVLGKATALKLYNEGRRPSRIKQAKRGFNQEYFAEAKPLRNARVQIPAQYADFYERLYDHCRQFRAFVDADWEHFDNNVRVSLFTNLTEIEWADNNHSLFADMVAIYERHADIWAEHTTTFSPKRIEEIFKRPAVEAYTICFYDGEHMTIADFLERTIAAPKAIKRNLRSIQEVDKEVREAIHRAMRERSNIYFTAQTGSGKTEHYLREIDTFSKRTLLAVPTYNLAREVAQRAHDMGKGNVFLLPEASWTAEDLALMRVGLPAESKSAERNQWRQEVKEGERPGLFICPHQQLSTLTGFHRIDQIIVDENIEEVLCPIYYLDISSIAKVADSVPHMASAIKEWAATAHGLDAGEQVPSLAPIIGAMRVYLGTLSQEDRLEVVSSMPADLMRLEDIEGFKSSDGESVYFLSPSQLMDRASMRAIPLKLFSATPRTTFIDIFFPKWLFTRIDINKATNQGEVVQFISNTGARGKGGDKVGELAKTAKRELTRLGVDISKADVISFKGSERIWAKEGFNVAKNTKGEQVHLLNCAGMDQWKGKDLIVAGKPLLPNEYMVDRYLDYCRIHHIKDDVPAERMTVVRTVEGIRSNIFGWNKKVLQAFEEEWLSFTLEQALGRARVVRTDAKVYVFTNYIVESADVVYG